ncbi:hypothetical protein NBRGN_006_00380 [Nocardia brasiliensis NBRC 14402]|nr:hypothetical protein NBRGN_006_00380 [Nocardia brasiliensis NBRC 14402]
MRAVLPPPHTDHARGHQRGGEYRRYQSAPGTPASMDGTDRLFGHQFPRFVAVPSFGTLAEFYERADRTVPGEKRFALAPAADVDFYHPGTGW